MSCSRWTRRRARRRLLWDTKGSLTVEAMLTLPVLVVVLLLCVGMVYAMQGIMIVDRAVAETCAALAESTYLTQQAVGLGVDIAGDLIKGSDLLKDNDWAKGLASDIEDLDESAVSGIANVAGDIVGYALAAHCLHSRLADYPELRDGIKWDYAQWPGIRLGEGGGGSTRYDEDDVVLTVTFRPARLNGFTALLPDSWQITIVKRERAWLTGRNILPGRGLEQGAGRRESGPLVYITRWGEKYHADECRYLARSKIPAYLNLLSTAYEACQVCRPPPRT